jgi:hypothetical protein
METIVNKIKQSVQSGTGLTCLYGSLDSINVQMGDQTEFPVAFFVLLNNGSLDDRISNYRERVDVAMFFVKPTEFDFESIENEAIISECKQCAFQWLNSLFLGGDLRYITTLNTSRVYNQMDDILTGYALRVRLEELVGQCINIPKPDPPRPNYLRFTALEDDSMIGWWFNDRYPNLEYSINDGEWTPFTEYVTLNTGDYIEFRNNGTPWVASGPYPANQFHTLSGSFDLSGNIMSLVDKTVETTVIPIDKCFYRLFGARMVFPYEGCNIVNAKDLILPATTLTSECYEGMFDSCKKLISTPELPATTLAFNCYGNMFGSCSKLTVAPELPATTLANFCYSQMFYDCQKLETAPELPATTLGDFCYSYMFNNCRLLTTAPKLPATTLATQCYKGMFNNCVSLNYIKCLATDTSAEDCTTNWLYNVSATGTFVKAPNSTWTTGANGIPDGWTVVENTDNG